MRAQSIGTGLLLTSLALAALGCAGEETRIDPTVPDKDQRYVSLRVFPSTVKLGGVTRVNVRATNFALVDPASNGANETGKGHYRLYIDEVGAEPFLESFTGNRAVELPSSLELGGHSLIVELVASDGSSFDPPLVDEKPFRVTTKTNDDVEEDQDPE